MCQLTVRGLGRGLISEQDKDKNWWYPASEQGGDNICVGAEHQSRLWPYKWRGPVLEQGQDRAYLCELVLEQAMTINGAGPAPSEQGDTPPPKT